MDMQKKTRLGELSKGAVFEMRSALGDCQCWVVLVNRKDGSVVKALRLGDGEVNHHFSPQALVCPIDLPFLLLVASDRLAENDAYQRGLRDGAGQELRT